MRGRLDAGNEKPRRSGAEFGLPACPGDVGHVCPTRHRRRIEKLVLAHGPRAEARAPLPGRPTPSTCASKQVLISLTDSRRPGAIGRPPGPAPSLGVTTKVGRHALKAV